MASAIPITEDEFRERTVSKYREHFNHVFTLSEFAQDAMGSYKGQQRSPYNVCLTLILPKGYKSFDAIRRLCEVASCEDAAVILRSLLNLLAVTRWISLDPTRRAGRYLAWYWVAMHSDAKRFKDRIPAQWLPAIHSHYDRVKRQFQYKDSKGKLRMAAHWYEPEVQNLRQIFAEVELENHYEEAYKPLSGIEHSDATSYLPMLLSTEQKEGERRLEIQSDLNVPHYLRNAFQYFGDIFRLCNRTNQLADAGKLEQIISEGVKFFKSDMKSRGISAT